MPERGTLDLHTIDVVTIDLIKWIKKARPGYQFGTDELWDSLIQRVTGYRTEEGMNDILAAMENRHPYRPVCYPKCEKLVELDKWVSSHVGAECIDYVELRKKIREMI